MSSFMSNFSTFGGGMCPPGPPCSATYEGFNVAIVFFFTKERSIVASPGMYVHTCDSYDRDAARSKFVLCALICKVRLRTGFYDYYAACA